MTVSEAAFARQRLVPLVNVAAATGDFFPRLASAVDSTTPEEARILPDLLTGLSIPAPVSFPQGAHTLIGDEGPYEG